MLPMPSLVGPRPQASPVGALPIPHIIAPTIPASRITHVVATEPEKPKAARATKADRTKVAKCEAKARIAAFVETKPSKADVLEYMKVRIAELAD